MYLRGPVCEASSTVGYESATRSHLNPTTPSKRQEVLRHRTGVLIKLSLCRPTSATSVEEAADACDDHAYEHRDAGEALRFAPAALVSAVSGWGGLSRSG